MRIVGYIEHPVYMVTVFQMDDKFSVKFEKNLLEQTYKYRGGPAMTGINDIKKIIGDRFLENVDYIFQRMEAARLGSLQQIIDEDEFDEII